MSVHHRFVLDITPRKTNHTQSQACQHGQADKKDNLYLIINMRINVSMLHNNLMLLCHFSVAVQIPAKPVLEGQSVSLMMMMVMVVMVLQFLI